jgi:DUF2934 family protein
MKTSVSPDSTPSGTAGTSSVHEAIRKRAEEIYIRSGRIPGHDLENWAQAEREVMLGTHQSMTRTAIVVEVKGVRYVGEYGTESCGGYQPGEFGAGADVPVRFEGQKMFVRRPNGMELETLIVKKIAKSG